MPGNFESGMYFCVKGKFCQQLYIFIQQGNLPKCSRGQRLSPSYTDTKRRHTNKFNDM